MARFWGEITGQKRKVSTIGGKDSGLHAIINGWDIGVEVRLVVSESGEDEVAVSITGGSNKPSDTNIIFVDSDGNTQTLKLDKEYRLVLPSKRKITLDTES